MTSSQRGNNTANSSPPIFGQNPIQIPNNNGSNPPSSASLHSGMNKHTTRASAILLSLFLAGCSDTSDTKSSDASAVEPNADTSYLDELAAKQGIALQEEIVEDDPVDIEPEPAESIEDTDPGSTEDEQREWELERQSKSLLGSSRDKAKNLRDQIQGSTTPGQGLAYTLSDEEYAASSGLRWEMPEDWRMAIPPTGHFAEMYIKNPLGNASVSFTKETDSARNLIRTMERQIIDPMGGRSRAQTSKKTIRGKEVQVIDLEGTYLDPGSKGSTREQIFYAIHAVIFDMGDSRILIKMWGPQDTVNQSTRLFDKMIDQTGEQ